MIRHYLKIALRSLMKHRVQRVLSIVGLAVGFVCFAYSLIWLRYERTFDSFHPDADRIYMMYKKSPVGGYLLNHSAPYPFAAIMKERLPEVEAATAFYMITPYCELNQFSGSLQMLSADTAFMDLFDVQILEGSRNFLYSDREVAITPSAARKLFGTEKVLGRQLDLGEWCQKTITALVSEWKGHSNIPYDLMTGMKLTPENVWYVRNCMLCFRLRQDADTADFARKLHAVDTEAYTREVSESSLWEYDFSAKNLNFCPITESYELFFKNEIQIRQTYIRMFVWIGVLVMVIALINYVSLLVSQMMNRSKELALRLVNGSSRRGLFVLFATELIMMLLVSGFISLLLMEWAEKLFQEISYVKTAWLPEALAYFIGVLLCSLLVAGCIIACYSRKSLTVALQSRKVPADGRMNFQRMSMAFQLLVSLLVLFCFTVLFRQLTYLSQTADIGFERVGRASVIMSEVPKEFVSAFLHDLRAQPYIREADKSVNSLLPQYSSGQISSTDAYGKKVTYDNLCVDDVFLRTYNIPTIQGSLQSRDKRKCLLTKSASYELGGPDLVGQSFAGYTIVGIVPDLYTKAPTVPVKPTLLQIVGQEDSSYSKGVVLIRYDERYNEELKRFVKEWFHERNFYYAALNIATEVYDSYLASERMLMRLLGVMAGVCVLISLFGVYAHVVLACERRRKEIAIRKVNGATAGLIVRSFLKEYFLLLLAASAFAFPLGSIVMQRWLEQYVLRVGLSWWIYAGIFLLLWNFIMGCIGRSVWRAARENPAEVIKSE